MLVLRNGLVADCPRNVLRLLLLELVRYSGDPSAYFFRSSATSAKSGSNPEGEKMSKYRAGTFVTL
jgi:hypothetical protein